LEQVNDFASAEGVQISLVHALLSLHCGIFLQNPYSGKQTSLVQGLLSLQSTSCEHFGTGTQQLAPVGQGLQ
jgi:hypothetical protein